MKTTTIRITGERLQAMYDNDMSVYATPGAHEVYWASRPNFMYDECIASVNDLLDQIEPGIEYTRDDLNPDETYEFEVPLVATRQSSARTRGQEGEQAMETKITIRRSDLAVAPITETQLGKWAISWSDAPFALVINDGSGKVYPDAYAVWGLPREMTVEEAWEDFDYADAYEVID